MTLPTVYMASSLFPGLAHLDAVAHCATGVSEAFGPLSFDQVQLCPQHHGILTPERADQLMARYPNTRFRLHANVRTGLRHLKYDASTPFDEAETYFRELASLSRRLKAPAYTLHAGRRETATLEQLKENHARIQALFDCPVGIEGMYPARNNPYQISTWQEYEWLLDSGIPMAIDLSHLNILAYRTSDCPRDLVEALITSPRTLEIHLSDNDGRLDSHLPLETTDQWWFPLLSSGHVHGDCFSEGNQRRLRDLRSPSGSKRPDILRHRSQFVARL